MVCKYLQSGEVKNCGKKREEELWPPAEKHKLQNHLYLQVVLCLYLCICVYVFEYLYLCICNCVFVFVYLYLQVKNANKREVETIQRQIYLGGNSADIQTYIVKN